MFGFNSWSDFSKSAQEKISSAAQTASESAKTGLKSVSEKTKTFAETFPDSAKNQWNKVQENVTHFVEEQKQQYKQVEHDTELKKRRKEKKARLLKQGVPPWYVFEDTNEQSPSNVNNNHNNNNSNDVTKNEELKLRILKLCSDENTFTVEAPSSSSVFEFYMESALPYATTALKMDPILPKIRYKLVPKRVEEEQFWKNYFYRVQLIRESMGVPKLDLSENVKDEKFMEVSIQSSQNKQNNNQSNNNTNVNNNKSIEDQSSSNIKSSIFEPSNNQSNDSSIDTNNNLDNVSIQQNSNKNKNKKQNDELSKKVISLDSSTNIVSGTSSLIEVTNDSTSSNAQNGHETNEIESNNNNMQVSNEFDANDEINDIINDDDEDEEDDFLASADVHVDALSPEARARMSKELGLSKVKSQENENDDNSIDADTEDVDALLANVDVDGASDISDEELAKVMSEI